MSDNQTPTNDISKALSTFCMLSGEYAKLLKENELRPEDYGKKLANALSQTIREARQKAGHEHVSQYVAWLERIQAQFLRSFEGAPSAHQDGLPEAWEP